MSTQPVIEKKKVNVSNIGIGAILNLMEVCTLGQPLEVMKTTIASNRQLSMLQGVKHVYARGGLKGFFQGLWPWAIIEASTKGAVLMFSSSEVEYLAQAKLGYSSLGAGVLGGIAGGCAQAYTTLGFCTCMKTVEMTRAKSSAEEMAKSSFQVFKEIYKREGIIGINKGINAVALRQMSNWGLRFGFSRYSEDLIKKFKGKGINDPLTASERIIASCSAAFAPCLNQFFEVARIEMQSKTVDPNRPKNMNMVTCLKYIYKTSGWKGLYKGVTLRMALSGYQSLFMIGIGGHIKELWNQKFNA
ncbi:related to Mitochondrial DNA replication protein YHM2 [Hanseniaspora guilliermondii]|uniref:Related to Mitochondrial DNA replication protein YHM2 n=1 Tax=Hanseniaspora guilliermondii TaxID=56406 RepID=A0A1L0B600_9ASCO|nr:related to Mitochondrial DNA replication protein YHM2 [Hanseniaspora guilliermondii]